MKSIPELFPSSYCQTFSDRKDGKIELVTIFPMSELTPEKENVLRELNKQGAGIFFTPNPCKDGRAEKDVTAIEWVYVDMDTGTKKEMQAKIKASPIRPDMIIESSRSYHLYWRVNCNKKEFDQITQGLIEFFDGDKAISSTNEVLRFPGFYHMKDPANPFMVNIIYQKTEIQPLGAKQMMEMYKVTPEPPKPLKTTLKSTTEAPTVVDEFANIKSIPIMYVLQQLGVEVKNGFIAEEGKVTSAHINVQGNYINRFSGKEGSGTTIDATMVYGKMTMPEAIEWLTELLLFVPKDELDPIDDTTAPFTWGTDELDRKFAPIQGDSFIILAGMSGSGKTGYTFDMAEKNARMGHRTLYLSLEMSTEGIKTRQARQYAGIGKEQWRRKDLIPEGVKTIYRRRKAEVTENENLILFGFGTGMQPTIQNITKIIKRVRPSLVFIDNFDLIVKRGVREQTQEESELSGKILALCKSEIVPIILVHHLRKALEAESQKMRGLSALRGSGKIVDNADMVLMCWRDQKQDQFMPQREMAKFTLAMQKDRDFDGGIHTVYFHNGSFYDKYPLDAFDVAKNVFYGDK